MAKCRSCGADIVWVKTANGKLMPVDADSIEEDSLGIPEVFDSDTMTSHFATCPNAAQHRKK